MARYVQGYKVEVRSENISASHFSSQPVMNHDEWLTGLCLWIAGIVSALGFVNLIMVTTPTLILHW